MTDNFPPAGPASRGLRLAGGTAAGALHRREELPAIRAQMRHVETDEQVRRFLADTDPERVGLCLDTGHVAYARGDAPRLIREHAGRVWYLHLKAVDPGVLAQVKAEKLSFADAVTRDVMCEPGVGVPALGDVTEALGSLPDGTFVIVEQDLYPCGFDRPYPIAARTRATLHTAGIG